MILYIHIIIYVKLTIHLISTHCRLSFSKSTIFYIKQKNLPGKIPERLYFPLDVSYIYIYNIPNVTSVEKTPGNLTTFQLLRKVCRQFVASEVYIKHFY